MKPNQEVSVRLPDESQAKQEEKSKAEMLKG
jgi:hypothetical protein